MTVTITYWVPCNYDTCAKDAADYINRLDDPG